MTRMAVVLMTLVLGATFITGASAAQDRYRGVSAFQLPIRVAKLDGSPWGIAVDYSPILKPESRQPVFQTAAELVFFFRKQDAAVQENGIWIVVTHPDAYSDKEKALLEDVKSMSRREKIPLFICRAAQLPNGWQRFDR
jgi:uncharacterized FlgJ-related protein